MTNQKIKTLGEWEKQLNFMLRDPAADLKQQFTAQEVDELLGGADKYTVCFLAYEDREKWLEINGYEVTRENMMNAELPNQTTPEPDLSQALMSELQTTTNPAAENGTDRTEKAT